MHAMARKSTRRPPRKTSKTAAKAAATVPRGRSPVGSGLAPGMQSINTYRAVENVGASMEFLGRAFGFTRGVVLADAEGQPRYAEMHHGSSVVMLGNGLQVLPQRPAMRTGSAEAEAPNASPKAAFGLSAIVGFANTDGWSAVPLVTQYPGGHVLRSRTFPVTGGAGGGPMTGNGPPAGAPVTV